MSFPLLPDYVADDVTQIPAEFLKSRKIRLLMLDFDNTIVPYTTDIPTESVSSWLRDMSQSGIQVCVVSNSKKNRVPQFCREHGLSCITHAGKPFTSGIQRCLQKFRTPASEAALIGDQIYTDTLGANCAGVLSILVRSIHNHNFWLKARHVFELPFIAMAQNRRITGAYPEKNHIST